MKCEKCKSKHCITECRCKKHFCIKHLSDHICTFNYKEHGKEILIKNNPKVVSERVIRI